MCGPAPITTLARSARPAWPSPCPGTPEKHSSAGGRLTSTCSKHALNTNMENSPSLWHVPPQTLPKTTRRQTSMPFCKTLLAQDRRMTLLLFYLTLMQLSLETLALTGRMLLAPHSSTEPPTTMATASCRSAEAQTCASLTPGFRVSKSIIGPGTAMMVSRKNPSITSSSRVDGCDASHSAVYSEAPNSGTPITVSYAQTYDWNWRHLRAHASTTNQTSRACRTPQPSCSTSVKSPTAMMPSLNQQTSGRTSKTPSQHAQQNV